MNAIKEKNTENYTSCIIPESDLVYKFQFVPSAEAIAVYSSVFEMWNINSERSYFLSLSTNIQQGTNPAISLTNQRFDVMSPDSSVFVSDYFLSLNLTTTSIPQEYEGTLQFTIVTKSDGLWYISTWIDTKKQDSNYDTWSILKANLVN